MYIHHLKIKLLCHAVRFRNFISQFNKQQTLATKLERGRDGIITGTSPLLHEFVDENADSDGVYGLSGDEEVIVVVDDESEQNKSGHARDHGEKGLDFRRLSSNPCRDGLDRPLLSSHGVEIVAWWSFDFPRNCVWGFEGVNEQKNVKR